MRKQIETPVKPVRVVLSIGVTASAGDSERDMRMRAKTALKNAIDEKGALGFLPNRYQFVDVTVRDGDDLPAGVKEAKVELSIHLADRPDSKTTELISRVSDRLGLGMLVDTSPEIVDRYGVKVTVPSETRREKTEEIVDEP